MLMLVTVAAYLPTTKCGFIWDDDDYVEKNQTLRTLGGLSRIWFELGATRQYYPLVFTTFWVEYHLWGLHPLGYHLVNILLHAAAAVVLWRVLRLLELPAAWLAAALFALHPVQVESVAWITERKNVLCALFYFASAYAFLRFQGSAPRPTKLYALALLAFLAALLSKTVACSLPAALLLVCWWKRGRLSLRDLWATAPFFLLGITFGLLTVYMEKHHVGARGEEWNLSLLQRVLLAGRILWFYAGKLIWPHPLVFIYPRWRIDPAQGWPYLYSVTALAVVVLLWLYRRRLGRGPLAAVLFFAGTLFPALGFFDVFPMRYSFVADHFQYLACVGLLALIAAAGQTIGRNLARWGPQAMTVLAVLVLGALGVVTWRQQSAYRNGESLWRDTLRKNPQAWMAHNNLGTLLQSRGKHEEALEQYRRLLEIKPDSADGYSNTALSLSSLGRIEEASAYYRRALDLDPTLAVAHTNLGNILQGEGRLDEAVEQYRQAVRYRPNLSEAVFNLANALLKQRKYAEALEQYSRALQLNPQDAEAQYEAGLCLISLGRSAEAVKYLREAVRLKPDWPAPLERLASLPATQPAEPAAPAPGSPP
jgi:tetratricopeptide (TPR) repeat protein